MLLQRDLLDFNNVVDSTWQNSFLTNDRTQCFLSENCPNHHIVSFIPLLFYSTFSCYCFFRKPTLISPTFYSVESQTYIVLCPVNIWESHSALVAKTVKKSYTSCQPWQGKNKYTFINLCIHTHIRTHTHGHILFQFTKNWLNWFFSYKSSFLFIKFWERVLFFENFLYFCYFL